MRLQSAAPRTARDDCKTAIRLVARQNARLRAAGVTRIFGGDLDTFSNPRLHSYRRDGARSGRMASLLWVSPPTD